jgi:hypothetical protein
MSDSNCVMVSYLVPLTAVGVAFIVSEALPFLPTRYHGVAQLVIQGLYRLVTHRPMLPRQDIVDPPAAV